MAIKFYVSVDGQTKLTRKMYCSVDGKTKFVKKIYASVDGKAKLIYDTVTVTYRKDNGYASTGTLYKTDKFAKNAHAEDVDGLVWFTSYTGRGVKFDFTGPVTSTMSLYEASYYKPSLNYVSFYSGNYYVPTDIQVPRSQMDIRVYHIVPDDTVVQRRIFAIGDTPAVDMYINGAGYYNFGVGNTSSSMSWSVASNSIKPAAGVEAWARINISGSNRYSQIWSSKDTDGHWTQTPSITQNSTNNTLVIGGRHGVDVPQWNGEIGQSFLCGSNLNITIVDVDNSITKIGEYFIYSVYRCDMVWVGDNTYSAITSQLASSTYNKYLFSANSIAVPAYTTGIRLIGAKAYDTKSLCADKSSSPYRKLTL